MCFFIASSLSISQSVLFGDILCLMLVTISHWGIPPSLSPPDLLMFFSHCSIYFLIFASRHIGAFLLSAFLLGHSPIFGFSTSCAGFMVVRPICRSLRVITQGIPLPSICLGHFPFFSFHHHRSAIYGHFRFHHHGFSSLGFRDFHHHRLTSMGLFIVSPPQVFTYGLFPQFSVQSQLFGWLPELYFLIFQFSV